MNPELTWTRRLAPIIAAQVFLWTTLALFAFGPWQWPLRNPGSLYAFVICAHLALLLGYLSAAHRAPVETNGGMDSNKLIRIGLWATVLVLPITCYAKTGHWVPDLIGAFRDPGKAYAEAHMYAEGGTNAGAYLRILAAPALAILFPLGIFFWGRLNWGMRAGLIATMTAVILMALATGQRRDMADLLIITPFVVAASHFARVTKLKRSTVVAGVCTAFLAVASFASYFVYSHISRVGKQAAQYGINPVTRQEPNLDSPILAVFPNDLQPGVVAILNYVTTGYYGLGLSMDRPHQPMYGAGHSMFLTRNFARLTNDRSFEEKSLPIQISEKDGFKYPVFWCTAYPYFANDLGFLGVVFAMFFVGQGLAKAWLDMLGGRNPFAVVFFCMLLTLVFYLPATNRMLQDGDGVVAFWTWLAIWSWSRLKLRASHLRLQTS